MGKRVAPADAERAPGLEGQAADSETEGGCSSAFLKVIFLCRYHVHVMFT